MDIRFLREDEIEEYQKFITEEISRFEFFSEEARKESISRKDIETIRQKLLLGKKRFIIAKDDDNIVGCMEAKEKSEGDMWISWVLVKEEYRGKGIGQMMYNLLNITRPQYIKTFSCIIIPGNDRSERFFKRNGFKSMVFLKEEIYGHDVYLWRKELYLKN